MEMKKIISLLLLAVMMFSLCACSEEPQPYFGHYEAVSMVYGGFAMPPEGESYVDINSSSKMSVFLEGENYKKGHALT